MKPIIKLLKNKPCQELPFKRLTMRFVCRIVDPSIVLTRIYNNES